MPPRDVRSSRPVILAWLLLLAWAVVPPAIALGQSEAEALSTSFRRASRRVLPAVVTVRPIGAPNPFDNIPRVAVDPFGNPAGQARQPSREAGGSGVVIDSARGLVLTNDHVVQGASQVVVVLGDGRERPAREVRSDPKSDLALLVIDPANLVQAEWGDSDSMETGDWVLAVGQPFGLSGTVTAGIVSGKGRGIGIALYEDLIQTDAAINPGNSGGPLVNLKGEVVGINSAIKSLNGGYEGVGFAVPATRAKRVAADLAEFGRVRRAYLGVTIRPVDPQTAERIGSNAAAIISGVTTPGPASNAGIVPGDIITEVGGKPVSGPGALQALVEVARVGDPLEITILRNDQPAKVVVRPDPQPDRYSLTPAQGPGPNAAAVPPGININVPGARIRVPGPNINIGPPPVAAPPPEAEPSLTPIPDPGGNPGPVSPPTPGDRPTIRSHPLRPDDGPAPVAPPSPPLETAARTPTRFPELGLRLSEPTPALIRRFRFDREPQGLIVTGVEPDGPADRGGLEVGMVVTDAANRKVPSLAEFREALARRPANRNLLIRVLKGSKAEFRVIVDHDDPAEGSPAPVPAPAPDLQPLPAPAPTPGPGAPLD